MKMVPHVGRRTEPNRTWKLSNSDILSWFSKPNAHMGEVDEKMEENKNDGFMCINKTLKCVGWRRHGLDGSYMPEPLQPMSGLLLSNLASLLITKWAGVLNFCFDLRTSDGPGLNHSSFLRIRSPSELEWDSMFENELLWDSSFAHYKKIMFFLSTPL